MNRNNRSERGSTTVLRKGGATKEAFASRYVDSGYMIRG
jgi:hypothetical protein